jgi:hypothetical protein
MMNQEADLPEEMEPLLQRQKFTSPRLKALLQVREGLEQLGILLEMVAVPEPPARTDGPDLSVDYPPLAVQMPSLEPSLSGLLDLSFALLDTEYRSIFTGSLLGLLTQEEKAAFLQDCLAFYRKEFESLLLPPRAREGAHAALMQLQSTVRHLPFSLEDRERVLVKLVHTMRALEDAQASIEAWTDGAREVSSSDIQPARFLLLENWMTLVRVFLSLRSWHGQSPAVFLLDHPSLADDRPVPPLFSENTFRRMKQRINLLWQRLTLLAEREIANLHMKRLEALEKLLARTQFDYADALVQEQERIVDSLKETPPENGTEDVPETETDGGTEQSDQDER